jgi:hypothetical protein
VDIRTQDGRGGAGYRSAIRDLRGRPLDQVMDDPYVRDMVETIKKKTGDPEEVDVTSFNSAI